jgi:tRNA(Ile)-lysidine synthetase-like protein
LICTAAEECINTKDCFTVFVKGSLRVRSRQSADVLRLKGGSKSLKKLYIDRKIPAINRPLIPVVTDEAGVVGVYGFGADLDHMADQLPAWQIKILKQKNGASEEKDNVE